MSTSTLDRRGFFRRASALGGGAVFAPSLAGLAEFRGRGGRVRLVRNHEIRDPAEEAVPISLSPNTYDARAGGGTTTLEVAIERHARGRVAGACFSSDGDVLFFNTQDSTRRLGEDIGSTYALWGPSEVGAL